VAKTTTASSILEEKKTPFLLSTLSSTSSSTSLNAAISQNYSKNILPSSWIISK